jgi:subtilase family serine protease
MNMHRYLSLCVTSNQSKGVARAIKAAAITTMLVATFTPALAQTEATQRSSAPEVAMVLKKPMMVPGTVIIPASSQIRAEDIGKRSHTNVRYTVLATTQPLEAPPISGYAYETPASLACVYQVGVAQYNIYCNPSQTVNTPLGGSQSIAIVDAYDDPEAAADLAYFSAQFGIPFNPSKFHVVWAAGYQPVVDPTGGWEIEESLDIEYAHAMAPNATLYLVEAASNADGDLFTAVNVASNLVVCGKTSLCPNGSTGKGEVSMSWGEVEYAAESEYDLYMQTPNVVYVASSGDSPGVSYPSASPFAVSAGGTSNGRSLLTGNLLYQATWADAGGGVSAFEPRPSYQSGITAITGNFRGTPDISANANPASGVWVYDTFPVDNGSGPTYSTWWTVGGTSVAAPVIAGIINAAGHFAGSSNEELTTIYANRAVSTDFIDINYGTCNYYSGSRAGTGWDLCTGVGVPNGLVGK